MELVGETRPFYHYAPFMLPAVFQHIASMTPLALATSLLMPLGIMMAALGSYVLAVELGGRSVGLMIVTTIICIPAFSMLIESGWFDFYWLTLIAPGTGYAIGIAAAVCATTNSYFQKKDKATLCLTLLLLFSLILVRAHMFLLLAPALFAALLLEHWKHKIRLISFSTILLALLFILLLNFSTTLNSLWVNISLPHKYLLFATDGLELLGLSLFLPQYPFGITMILNITIIMVSILGIYIIIYPFTLYLNLRKNGFSPIESLPLFTIVTFIFLMLFSPEASNGDFTEYKHRHFPLLYVIVSIYTLASLIKLIDVSIHSKINKPLSYIFSIIVFSITILISYDSNPAQPNIKYMKWSDAYHNQAITPGVLEVSSYIAKDAKKGDVLATISGITHKILISAISETMSLTGIPSFVSRSNLKKMRSQCYEELVNKRLDILAQLSKKASWSEAKLLLEETGIRWLLVGNEEILLWDNKREFAVFSFKDLSVYDVGEVKKGLFLKSQC